MEGAEIRHERTLQGNGEEGVLERTLQARGEGVERTREREDRLENNLEEEVKEGRPEHTTLGKGVACEPEASENTPMKKAATSGLGHSGNAYDLITALIIGEGAAEETGDNHREKQKNPIVEETAL